MDPSSSLQNAVNALTLRQLQYFVAVAESEHFTRAAERLFVAQPSLSRQIKELEDALGVELFVRDTRGVRLTDAGRELLERARNILAMLERTVDAVRSAAAGDRGRLTLGFYGPSFYNNAVTRMALERLRIDVPNVEVVSQELFSEQIVERLRDGRLDVGFSRGIARNADIESRVVHVEPLVVLVAESDPLASQPRVALADLNERAMIAFPWELSFPLNQHIAELMQRANVTLNTVREVTQLSSIGYHVSLGEGVAIVPVSSAVFPMPGVCVREFSDPEATADLVVLTRRGERSPIVQRFLDYLR